MQRIRAGVKLGAMAIKGYSSFPKAPPFRLFSVICRTLVGEVPLSRDAVGVFYSPSRLGKQCRWSKTNRKKLMALGHYHHHYHHHCRWADSKDSFDVLSLTVPYPTSFLLSSLVSTQCPHKTDESKFLLRLGRFWVRHYFTKSVPHVLFTWPWWCLWWEVSGRTVTVCLVPIPKFIQNNMQHIVPLYLFFQVFC